MERIDTSTYNYKRENMPSWILNESEGWNLFLDKTDNGDSGYIIRRLPDSAFKIDIDAHRFVISKAVADHSKRHIHALEICRKQEKLLIVDVAKDDLGIDIGFHPEHGLCQIHEDGHKDFFSTSRVPVNGI